MEGHLPAQLLPYLYFYLHMSAKKLNKLGDFHMSM